MKLNATGPVRMKDIARDLGLSVVTVSKVFRGHQDISPETRQRVLERLTQLNYRPNHAARSLATGRSYTMAFVAPDLVHPFFSEVAKQVAAVLRGHGYYLLMSSSDEEPEIENQEIEHLLTRSIDALLMASAQPNSDRLRPLLDRKLPLILIDRNFPDLGVHFVGVDDRIAGMMATEHLIEQGCRKIAHITVPSISTSVGRFDGYKRALRAAELDFDSSYVFTRVHGDSTADETGYEAMKRLLALRPRPDGVFCQNDPTAMGAMKAILEAGLRIPDDVAVVGCGNIRYSDFLRIPLTTIDQNCEEIGRRAAELAIRVLNGDRDPRSILLEPKLIVRDSSLRHRSA
ncbi:MAG TPA: LacI family DNA-binding transcriptional regulator [Bryobacteraceae bacterium]|nr:LacI family DNA-binding transcriptional regulator [Bryobacteraceae bacterium]